MAGPKQWGSLARKGANRLKHEDSVQNAEPKRTARREAPDQWVRVDDEVRDTASRAVGRGRSGGQPPRRRAAPDLGPPGSGQERPIEEELAQALNPTRAGRAQGRLKEASRAFERERFEEARKILKPLAEEAPSVAAIRELYGLTSYRLGKWKDAVRELEAFRQLTGSTEQHPVLADSYRALKRWPMVEDLWEELRAASPSADLVAEGRIVMAGSLADRGRLAEAVALLERAKQPPKRVQVHHLRQAYALADLYERSGDASRARELFRWVAYQEPDFADAAERAAGLA